MNYKIETDKFEGPLDLLLHLIKEKDIDICDIKIEDVTKQYLEYIMRMKDLNLSIASEYLVMASELVEMKSKTLLPRRVVDSEDEYEEDPREILIERLLAYKKYKEVTKEFKELELTRKLVFTKQPENLNEYVKEDEKEEELSIRVLLDAFNELLSKKDMQKPITTRITKREISVSEKILKIRDILNEKKRVNFEDLFEKSTKQEIIISFLSILEMIKQNEIDVKQDRNFNSIMICLKEGK
ncbi:MAG: segregation/condensation protein A [Bacilli bacterium]